MDKTEIESYVKAGGNFWYWESKVDGNVVKWDNVIDMVNQKVYNIERAGYIISFTTDFMSPGDRKWLPDVLFFFGDTL